MAESDIDSGLWYAISGSSTRIPSVDSDVYYFPQGHIENSYENRGIEDVCNSPPILCKVYCVRHLCTHSPDQAFVTYILYPIHRAMRNNKSGNYEKMDQNDIVYFSKILTESDVSNDGVFSVPRFCADSIFPRFNFSDDPPLQTLKMFGAHQNAYAYEFTHIYRGTPRRHLLTTGWSKFVKEKKLVAGDSVVFMKEKSNRRLFIGARRLQFECGEVFSEDRFREGIKNASKERAFEVVYFPRMGMPDFVVHAEKVEKSMVMEWKVGMRVKMVVETENSSRMALLQGSIESVSGVKGNGSPWGMIEVAWDEPEILGIPKRVSPWQIECAEPPEEEHHSPPPPPSKKLKVPIPLPYEEANFSLPYLNQSTSTHNSGAFDASLDPPLAVSNSDNGSFTHNLGNGLDSDSRPVSSILNPENAVATYSIRLFGKTINAPRGSEN